MQGKKLCELYPEGCNVLYLQGTSGMIHTLQRREGFETAVNELGNDIHILDVQDADYVKDEGMRITEAWIQKYADPDSPTGVSFQAIVAGNDQMALGAMEALKTAGIPNGTITLMGIDGTAPCIQAIADGMMTCTIYQSSDHVADVTIDCLKLLAEGKKPEHEYFVSWEMIDGENYEMYQSS
jgi:inositol transport system substrate-binding protein